MDAEYIHAELDAITTEKFVASDLEGLLKRAQSLFEHIETLPNYLLEWTDAYVRAAAAIIYLLSGAVRFVDVIVFADDVFDKLQNIDLTAYAVETLPIFCQAMSRAAFCHAQVGNKKEAFNYIHQVSLLLESTEDNVARVRFYISTAVVYDAYGSREDKANAIGVLPEGTTNEQTLSFAKIYSEFAR